MAFEILNYEHDPRSDAYGLEAAEALELEKHTVFKTLLIELEAGSLAVALLPVHHRLNLKAAAKALGAKRAHLALPQAAERSSGYVVGGISPFGQKKRLPTVIDGSALELEFIHVSGGRRGVQVRLAVKDLIAVTDAVVAAVV